MSEAPPPLVEKAVWDLPTRLFHWALAACVIAGWLIGDYMSFTNISWHFYLGYATGGLLAFRLVWGLIGPPSARLSALKVTPGEVIRYLGEVWKRQPSAYAGHTPLGKLSVIALLLALTVQVGTGLFSESDDFFSEGPLSPYVDSSMRVTLTGIHHTSSEVVLVLVLLHLGAIAFYGVWKQENLIRAMITGRKTVRGNDQDTA